MLSFFQKIYNNLTRFLIKFFMNEKKSWWLFDLLKPYKWLVFVLLVFTIISNALNLVIPQLLSKAIDSFNQNTLNQVNLIIEFLVVSFSIFVFVYLQNIVQVYVSEKVARNLRTELISKIATQDYNYVQKITSAKLLTNLTSDVDWVKTFVSQVVSSLISSVFIILWASVLLFYINRELTLTILAILPIIWITFWIIFKKVRKLFKESQETIDWLNRVINESILWSALIRILNSQIFEYNKFLKANTKAKNLWLSVLKMFAILTPIITFTSNIAILVILLMWGHYVIIWNMTLWEFTAFNSYLSILIFPIIIIWFTSSVISQASASYARIEEVLDVPEKKDTWKIVKEIKWDIELKNISLKLWEKIVLNDISFSIKAKTKTAIIWPTAAWKTQLLALLTWLVKQDSWIIEYDSIKLEDYEKTSFYKQVALVFQDSNIFNLTLRENIAFSNFVNDESLDKAISTAELQDFIKTLPDWLDTVVSERWTSLSWWQKQRIMLARALAINPKVLFLDDFTARLDRKTEKKILQNVHDNYDWVTLISVTQKIESIKDFDQIILIMEWELIAIWKHEELLKTCPEYMQIYKSQFSTNNINN